MKQILPFLVCILCIVQAHAITFIVDGITYDNSSSTVYEGRYMHVKVTAISKDVKGNVVIPEIPAEYSSGLIYFRVVEIANNLCQNRTDITSLTLPGSAKIGISSFADCAGLASVAIVNSTYNGGIGNNAFANCTKLSTVNIGKNTTSINDYSFTGCTNLSQITVDAANPNYASINGVLYDKACTKLLLYPPKKAGNSFIIPNGVTTIQSGAFYNCNHLTTITIPNSLTGIDGSTFEGAGLNNLVVDASHSGYSSFDGILYNKDRSTLVLCPNKRSGTIVIPTGTINIGRFAFIGCSGLTSITIPASVTDIYYNSFRLCSGLNQLIVDPENPIYTSVDGIIYTKDLTVLDSYPPNKSGSSFVIPASVTTIAKGAFMTCDNLTEIKIPNGITSIGGYAFWECSNLTSVTIPKTVNSIGEGAFLFDEKLSDIYVSWTTPTSVTLEQDAFYGIKSGCVLHVPVGLKAAYQDEVKWQVFNVIDDFVVSSVPGINKTDLQIYPNPVQEGFYVAGLSIPVQLTLMDISGKQVLSILVEDNEYININGLPHGIYVAKITVGNESLYSKIMKE